MHQRLVCVCVCVCMEIRLVRVHIYVQLPDNAFVFFSFLFRYGKLRKRLELG